MDSEMLLCFRYQKTIVHILMPGRERNKIIRDMVIGFGAVYALYSAHQAYQSFDLKEATLAALRFVTDYDSRLREGTASGIKLELPRRVPLDKRRQFAELVAAPGAKLRTVRANLIHGYQVTKIEEMDCALDGLTIQVSEELSERPRRVKDSLVAETVFRIVGEHLLIVPKRPGMPRYVDDPESFTHSPLS